MSGAALCRDKNGCYAQLDDGTRVPLSEDDYRTIRANGGLGIEDYDSADPIESGTIEWKAKPLRSYHRYYR